MVETEDIRNAAVRVVILHQWIFFNELSHRKTKTRKFLSVASRPILKIHEF